MNAGLQGYYSDVGYDAWGEVRFCTGWRKNLIVAPCNRLLAALIKGDSELAGLQFWAVGTGEDTWDEAAPTPDPSVATLGNEITRQVLTTEQVIYLNTDEAPSATPTEILEITATFTGEELTDGADSVSLREFGIFGGDATEMADSGFLIDHVIHSRIDLGSEDTLERRLRLIFNAGVLEDGFVESGDENTALATLPLMALDGIGTVYAEALAGVGVETIRGLVEFDPLVPVAGVPLRRMHEFCAKARLASTFRISAFDFTFSTAMSERTVSEILIEDTEALAGATGVPPDRVLRMQEKLAILQMALDESTLREVQLGALLLP